jgi:peptide subunit release factor 1 (eRF1)
MIQDIIEQEIKNSLIKLTDVTGFDHSGTALEAFAVAENELKELFTSQQHKLLQSIVEMIPKEKPMNTFSFVLNGEELELYMQHKGFNQCRAEFKAKLTTNIKE